MSEEDGRNKLNSDDLTSSPVPTFAVHTPDGEEEKPLFEENTFLPLVEIPPPPDGGWGWVVCISCFMCNFILDGITYTFGVLLEPLVEAFDSNKSTVSWVGSVLAGVYLMSGPFVGGFVNKYGCRPVCIAGSIVSCVGIALSTLSPNVTVLMLTYGVVGGIGLGLIYLPAVISVGYYFEKRRALATGISVCGSGVGTFVFPPLATYLIRELGWKGANLVFAGLCLNCTLFGMLMRPLELAISSNPATTADKEEAKQDFTVQLPDGTHHMHNNRETHTPSLTPNVSFHLSEEGAVAGPSLTMVHLPTIEESDQSVTEKDLPQEKHRSVLDVFPKPDRGSVKNAPDQSQYQVSKFNVTPVKASLGLPRNSTAPNFVDCNHAITRNSSTPGFHGLLRLSSQCSEGEYQSKILSLNGSQLLSNTTLHLEPHALSRRNSERPIVRPLYRKDVFFSGSVTHLINSEKRRKSSVALSRSSSHNIFDYRHSIISIPRHSRQSFSIPRGSIVASHLSFPPAIRKASIIDGEAIQGEGKLPILSVLKEMADVSLLKNTLFLLIGISNALGMLGFYTPFVYLPNMAAQSGVELEDANFLISMIGISNTIGRVLSGWISDFECVDSLMVVNFAILLSGFSILAVPLMEGYLAYSIIALCFGAFVSAYISLTSIVLVDLLGLDKLTSAFGLLVMFRGISSIVGPPIAGAVFDQTNSYDISFYMAGGFLIAASIVSFAADVLRRRNYKPEDTKSNK